MRSEGTSEHLSESSGRIRKKEEDKGKVMKMGQVDRNEDDY
jgi:hypothetical protein